jgi:hypothetical protein
MSHFSFPSVVVGVSKTDRQAGSSRMEIKKGCVYLVHKPGFFSKVSHLEGKRVTALTNGAPGFFQNSVVDVRTEDGELIENVDINDLA